MSKFNVKVTPRRVIGWFFLLLFVALVLIAGVSAIRWAKHSKTPAEGYGSYTYANGARPFSLDLFPSLVIDENATELKVMQLADPQIKFGSFTHDRKTMDLIDRAIRAENPDICVVTGDLTLSIFTYDAYKYFADFMEQRQQYWTVTYGNHDGEFDSSKHTLYNLLKNYKYCLFDCGPSDIDGESNFLINVFKGSKDPKNLAYSLVMMDSGMYPDGENSSLAEWCYDWIKQSQMDWYAWAINGLKSIKADVQTSMFFHIPLRQFADMYYLNQLQLGNQIPSEVQQTLPNVTVSDVKGAICEGEKSTEEVVFGDDGYTVGIFYQGNGPDVTDHPDVFSYVKSLGSTKAIFCGHDHVNTLKGYYDGVYLGYGLCCGYHTYPYFEKSFFLLDWLGFSDQVLFNRQLWLDQNGQPMQKGTTNIVISLQQDTYGNLTVTDRFDSTYPN